MSMLKFTKLPTSVNSPEQTPAKTVKSNYPEQVVIQLSYCKKTF